MEKTGKNRLLPVSVVALACLCLALIGYAVFNQDWTEPTGGGGGTCSCVAGIANQCKGTDSEYWGEEVAFGCTATSNPEEPVRAWIDCPSYRGDNTVTCYANYEGQSDRAGVQCKDTGSDNLEKNYC